MLVASVKIKIKEMNGLKIYRLKCHVNSIKNRNNVKNGNIRILVR